MAKTNVDIEVDYEKRKAKATKEIDKVLKDTEIGLKIQWNQNGPFLAMIDLKQYEDARIHEETKPAKGK